MLKGHIDSVLDDSVSGWIYSRERPVAGERVLAFCGAQCIGSAEVGIYRDDLFQAGLDDGRLGFQISFDRAALTDPGAMHVRMEGSDFSLLIKDFWNAPKSDETTKLGLFSAPEIERIDWMASRGWLNQGQYASAKAINRMGIYQQLFSRKSVEASSLDALVGEIFADCLSIMLKLSKKAVAGRLIVQELSGKVAGLQSPFPGVVGLYNAAFSCRINEGLHRPDMQDTQTVPIIYDNSAYQLMMVHVDCCEDIVNVEEGVLKVIKLNS